MAIVRPSFNCTLKSNHPAAEAFYPILPVINDGEGSVMLLESKRGSSDGTNGTITFTVSYDDDFSNQRLLYLSHTNVAVGSSVSSELKLTGIDFSKSNIRCITAKTNQVDVVPSEFTMAIWKPEIILNSFHAYRSDGSKNASTTGQYVTVEGNVSFDLPNLEAITNIGGTLMPLPSEDFSPVGQYRFKITDGENTIYSDYAYVTNQGTLESYQNTKNGIEFSEVINCSTINLDSANISIETEIVSEIGGIVGYEGDGAEVLLNKNVYFHMSPNGRGLGIGGIPMHGNYEAPALDIHWPVYLKQFFSNGIDMTLDEETVSLWTEILGGGVTLSRILSKLGVELSKLGVDFIIESGNNYTKWNSGKAEIWGTSVWDAGSTKRGKTVLYPSAIKLYGTPYSVNVTPNINGSIVNKYFVGNSAANAAKYTDGFEVRAECSTSSYSVTFDYYIVGRWK